LDRRRHVSLSARVVDAHDPTKVLSTIRTLASKSGGEVAEIVAFILGAALLYRLGRDGTSKPGFAPVLLDEGFIKADSRFTSRAISAWQGFGFQLIIAVPEEKYQSVVSKAERVLNIVADADRRSYVSTFDYVAPEDVAEEDDAEQ
ncbi:MAG: SbcC/MukB-like Walker B domain-containing protein, partial [Coriobacteriales bacterium]|nr:SbcC/MukB-like Walker B domain-containing protein [Coriobacteriales bacterium]